MKEKAIKFSQIGIIHTPFINLSSMPIQPAGAKGVKGTIELRTDLTEALDDLAGFSHIYLVYYFHKANGYRCKVKPFLDDQERGLFATRAPNRPNAIGLSVVRLNSIEKNILYIENIDVLDETPLLDIKPFIGQIEPLHNVKIGWLETRFEKFRSQQSDDRFV